MTTSFTKALAFRRANYSRLNAFPKQMNSEMLMDLKINAIRAGMYER